MKDLQGWVLRGVDSGHQILILIWAVSSAGMSARPASGRSGVRSSHGPPKILKI